LSELYVITYFNFSGDKSLHLRQINSFFDKISPFYHLVETNLEFCHPYSAGMGYHIYWCITISHTIKGGAMHEIHVIQDVWTPFPVDKMWQKYTGQMYAIPQNLQIPSPLLFTGCG
jgi:hypothetical protein